MLSSQHACASPLPVNEYEEYTWMRQLQEPEQVQYQLGVWQLAPHTDLARLKQSIEQIVIQHQDLNARYEFSNSGELYKYLSSNGSACVNHRLEAPEQINDLLITLQQQVWQAESDPPFCATLIDSPQHPLLILQLHPILAQQFTLATLCQQLEHAYAQQPPEPQHLNLIPFDLNTLNDHPRSSDSPIAQLATISQLILAEFRHTLAEPSINADDDFFDFGGHSLLATRVIGQLQNRYGLKLNFNDFFKFPSANALAKQAILTQPLPSSDTASQPVTRAPLTFAQDFLWQAYAAYDFSPIYNLPFAVEFQQPIDETVLFQAFQDVLIRHSGLRTLFKTEQQQTYQYTIEPTDLAQYRWFWYSSDNPPSSLAQEAAYRFDLSKELGLRVRLFKHTNGHTLLSLLVHHMVMDEWSLNTLMTDLAHAYAARSQQQPPQWDNQVPSIQTLALQQQQTGLNQQHLHYWQQQLQHARKDLTLDLSRVAADDDDIQVKWLTLTLDTQAQQKISAYAKQQHASVFSVFYTAIALALHEVGQLQELVIGTSAAGRTEPQFFDTIGYFTTMVAHRIQFTPAQSFAELLQHTSELINQSMAYADVPINHIQTALGMRPDEGLLFDVYIHIHASNALNGALQTADGSIPYRQILPERHESMFGLHFEIMENMQQQPPTLSLIITYQAQRFPTAIVKPIAARVHSVLTTLETDTTE